MNPALFLEAAALMAAAIFLIASVRSPVPTILALYAAVVPVGSAVTLSVPLPKPFNSLSSGLGLVLGVCLIIHLLTSRKHYLPGSQVALWLLFLSWSALTIFWALNPHDTIAELTVAAPLILLMIVVSFLQPTERDLDVVKVAVVVGGVIVGLYALYFVATGKPLPNHGISQRLSVSAGSNETDPNILAASLLLPFCLAFERVLLGGSRWLSKGTWRFLGAVCAALIFIAVLLTGSRGGLLSLTVTFGLILFLGSRQSSTRRAARRTIRAVFGLAVCVVVVGGASLALDPNGPAARIASTSALQRLSSGSSSGRTQIWTTGWAACKTECAFGGGFGDFPQIYNKLFAVAGATKNVGAFRPAHDIYLQISVETGFVGLTLFGLAILSEFLSLTDQSLRLARVVLAPAVAGLLIAMVFLSAIWFKYFWLTFIIIRLTQSVEEGHEVPVPSSARLPGPRVEDLANGAI
jgi:O-antigen ligase